MQLNEDSKSELRAKSEQLKIEIVQFLQQENQALAQMREALQQRQVQSQKTVDNMEGKLAGYLELIGDEPAKSAPAQAGSEPKPVKGKVIPFKLPDQPAGKADAPEQK